MKKRYFTLVVRRLYLVLLAVGVSAPVAFGQYFGRNKAQYKKLNFEVLETPHFEIYHYLRNKNVPNELGQASERWYTWHSKILGHRFKQQNPLIFYNHHADFQQTTVISGLLGTGTGGVTEGLRNRVIMPLTASNQQTDHVLGHELVHAFQYDMLLNNDSTSANNLNNIPLWMVEGLAEYMSIGRVDAHTAIWMRDAVLNKDIPSVDDLYRKQHLYFPYRYGQALWAYIAGLYGDNIISPLFRATGKYGVTRGMLLTLGSDDKGISRAWKNALTDYYTPFMKDTTAVVGKRLISEKNGGQMNVSPALSPDGKYVAFISERNVISTDLYIADAQTGKIIKRISNNFQRSHIDEISFLEAAGTWSPDSKQFASIIFSKGRTNLLVLDIARGRTVREIEIPGVEYINNAAWSPDGRSILISGLVEGRSDLYLYDLNTKKVENLTNDAHSDLQPAWSADGRQIVFASDRGGAERINLGGYSAYRLSTLNLATRQVNVLDVFSGADNLNPQFGPDNDRIYFLSNADGLRNLYEYNLAEKQVYRLTNYFTGISGITAFSPALSVSTQTGQMVYNVLRNRQYNVYGANVNQFTRQPVAANQVNLAAATLPPADKLVNDLVGNNIRTQARNKLADSTAFTTRAYDPKFELSYIGGSAGGGTATYRGQGPVAAGGVATLFTDILNNHQVMGAVQLNGEIYDLAGQVAYLNQKRKFKWGASIGHIPYVYGGAFYAQDTIKVGDGQMEVLNSGLVLQRMFQDQVALFGSYAFSQTKRFEVSTSFARYSNRVDIYNTYYDALGRYVGEDREKGESAPGFNLGQTNIAFVGDNSTSGVTSPLNGHRFRFDIGRTYGGINYNTILADYRKYWFTRPVGFALRAMHYGRYGGDAERMFPLYLGNEYFVRGYNNASFRGDMTPDENSLSINQVIGSRLAVANAEVRLPFSGPERLSLIKSGFLFSDLVFFADGGLAWSKGDEVSMSAKTANRNMHFPVYSTGASLRINLFGYIIVEPYYAIPLQRNGFQPNFGFFLSGGGF
ncbi:peptidase S9 [Adhaeribacter aerolatus]|uniref:Peptidase S9 n=1 Tax=Adhaeribacter aerolatus TaxID=670289 RepID=A0A512B1W6_9BACT|nr:PD40 domain-containing protein [Adhaeribacter aerolatus]GEO05940.1 peptidase S9 [Adhaeribacter aerolatus]